MTATLNAPAPSESTGKRRPVPRIRKRAGLRQVWVNSLTMSYRGILQIKHNPFRLMDVTIQPIVFILMFTYVFGGAMMGNVPAYLPWIIPGVMVQTVIGGSVVTGTQMREDMDKGVFDRFKSLPIARIAPLAGALMADMVRYTIATTIALLMGLLLGYRPGGGVLGVLAAAAVIILCSFALSWVFALIGVTLRSTPVVQGMSMLVLSPLTFMSNIFAPPWTMPWWMQDFVKINPVTHLVSASRALMNNGHVGADLGWTCVGAAVIVIVFAPLAVNRYMSKT